ncbi:hypothetical protein SH584_11395 [Sphingomonas sp. LY29]|uniref:hypothetical protein n=1 Tax=Sphingomonas sp. LY29 TaxID=3095341 RepID=UPI002D76E7BC|nr:hypothetical protein [Sphingomonas sp. LY29]WRP25636.1 hypothetical protein SH584_11395 [Sphingomonas sp. LY29]
MGQVIPIVNEAALNSAWDEHRLLQCDVMDNPVLLLDRQHTERRIRAWRRFERLIHLQDRV